MKFSIVIPALNEAGWIGSTLTAVLAQEYTDFEVIVVNNNSTDDTETIVQQFAEQHTRIKIINCPTRGVMNARNEGYKAASGDVIVQLDADTLPAPDWLAKAEQYLRLHRCVAVVGAYDYYDANPLFRYGALWAQYVFLFLGNYYAQKRKFGALMIGGNSFITKRALDAAGGYDLSHTFYNDDLVVASAVSKIGSVDFYKDITVRSSARRYKQAGYFSLQKKYNKGTWAILLGRPIPRQGEETIHPR